MSRIYSHCDVYSKSNRGEYTGDSGNTDSVSSGNDIFGFGDSLWFFIKERKAHYAELDNYVFRPLAGLQFTVSHLREVGALPLLPHLTGPVNSIHYPNARLHLEKNEDTHDLPDRIEDLISSLETYNNDVESFYQLINLAITTLTSIPQVEINFGNIHTMVISCWNQIIQDPNNNNILSIRARLNDLINNPESYHVEISDDGFFRLNQLLIAVGQTHGVQQIEVIIRENVILNNILL